MSEEVGKQLYKWVGKIVKDNNVYVGNGNRELLKQIYIGKVFKLWISVLSGLFIKNAPLTQWTHFSHFLIERVLLQYSEL